MKIIEVPILNDDGSVQITHVLTAEQTQALLQFALSFLTAAGMSVSRVSKQDPDQKELNLQ